MKGSMRPCPRSGISAVFLVLGIESSSVGFVLHYKIQSVVMQINGKILFQELDRSQKERREVQREVTISRLSGLPPHVCARVQPHLARKGPLQAHAPMPS